MKKSQFILSAVVLGLSLFNLPAMAQTESTPSTTLTETLLQAPSYLNQQTPSLAPMLEKVLPSVVTVNVTGTQSQQDSMIPEEFKFFFGRDMFGNSAPREFKGLGSGVIIDAEKGYVLTNNHVIDNADNITLSLQDGREVKAKLLGTDAQSDVALLQIEEPKNLTAIKLADSDKIRVGDYTVAIGNPFGLGQTVTSGIISALGRSTGMDGGSYENYIQTDAAVNRGNSGGALINLRGELIGINTAIIAPSGGNVGIAFAIPSNMASSLVHQIVEFGEVRRGILGIKGGELSADLAKAFGIDSKKGAFVSEVLPNSAAAKAGLKAGDVITEINGQPINSFAELRAKIATTGAGKTVNLTYLREGKTEKADVVLQSDDQAQTSANSLIPGLNGADLGNYDKDGRKGVEILKVEAKSSAEQLGLQVGDVIVGVNRQAISNIGELRKILDNKPSAVALNITRGNNNFYLLIP
ncbi:Do family serine endopeptidase [Testudinibacter sp. TR-2022]|uniref:Do family serine endopeptidase n=1 Tax=Testudinibacter sp. TR-2022 TaxID=2585029 RepID=UPI00111A8A6E|nr:Do family serine endopeptidase [Testudinibacter sp. TR-2022]TNH03623.1 Do family serine endopeptidase [Pasteurellaceae bacterium Phil11]TNH22659.1 Do family serine endopeptidase [Testudinibacter sp. TR-2022]TNH27929.1 Do family serine endopeptidase [Testudinibacter sp. TR-2022]